LGSIEGLCPFHFPSFAKRAGKQDEVAQRKRRPFSGGVFFDSLNRNQLLSLVSILMP
jgi:hypothetical protein